MADRTSMPKKLRFEVFKRDKFMCQYCGAKAPDILLHVDHVKPVADGGPTEILNLITACAGCNLGKGARPLSDNSIMDAHRSQMEDLQDRREQIEMMLLWRDALAKLDADVVDMIAVRFWEKTGLLPNESGKADLRKWLKRYTLEEILNAADRAFDVYLTYQDDKVVGTSWEFAFKKIPAVAQMMKEEVSKPYLVRLFYIQGILRNRFRDRYLKCVETLESFVLDGVTVETLESIAKRSDDWQNFCDRAEQAVKKIAETDE